VGFTKLATLMDSIIIAISIQAADVNFSAYGSLRGGHMLNDEHFPRNLNYDLIPQTTLTLGYFTLLYFRNSD
jgi:hypothetical protein